LLFRGIYVQFVVEVLLQPNLSGPLAVLVLAQEVESSAWRAEVAEGKGSKVLVGLVRAWHRHRVISSDLVVFRAALLLNGRETAFSFNSEARRVESGCDTLRNSLPQAVENSERS